MFGGPYRTPASCGAVYFLTIVDDFSRAVWTYLMLEKSEVSDLLQNFCAMSIRQFNNPVQTVRSDNGTKFLVLKKYFQKNGIIHQTSCVDTPQQNGRVERKHRHILNVARACLFQSKLPVTFWGESILAAAHIINRTPSQVLDGKTPYEVLHGTAPVYTLLRVFGCLAYAHRRARDKDKFGERSRKCLFVGYPFGKKAWRLYDLETNEFFVSRDVVFLEDQFPGIKNTEYVTPPVMQDNSLDDWLLPTSQSRGSMLPTPATTLAPVPLPSTTATDTPGSPIATVPQNMSPPSTPTTSPPATTSTSPSTPQTVFPAVPP